MLTRAPVSTDRHRRLAVALQVSAILFLWPMLHAHGQDKGFDAKGVTLLSQIPAAVFAGGSRPEIYDIWGYVSPAGREYAVLGSTDGTAFVDVTDPTNPVVVSTRLDAPFAAWDMAVFDEYAYSVGEDGGGLKVFDLTQIDNGVVTFLGAAAGELDTAHNIAVNPDSGFAYPCAAFRVARGFIVYDLSDPADPQPGVIWEEAFVHDLLVVSYEDCPYTGREGACEIAFAFGGTEDLGGVWILDVTEKANIVTIGIHTYPTASTPHQGWLSEDRRYLFFDDEGDEFVFGIPVTTYVIDVQDLANPFAVTSFTNGRIGVDHNLMVRGHFVFEANYRSGLRIFDFADINNIIEVGYFDTSPLPDELDIGGAWSPYTQLPSGIVLVSDMQEGLFVLDVFETTGCQTDRHCADADACTSDTCDAKGICDNAQLPVAAPCDDGERCTVGDECDAAGTCVGLDVNTFSCEDNGPCSPGACDTQTGSCVCLRCEAPPPAPIEESVVIPKNRSFTFAMESPGPPAAIRVVPSNLPVSFESFEGTEMWIDEPQEVCELSGIGPNQECPTGVATFLAATLTCDPFVTDWASLGPVHVVHRLIVPDSTYELRAISQACLEVQRSEFSPPLIVQTNKWGDVSGPFDSDAGFWQAPDGSVDVITDAVAVIAKFSNRPGAPAKARSDLEPAALDFIINITDIVVLLDAFRGLAYPFEPGPPCDSEAAVRMNP